MAVCESLMDSRMDFIEQLLLLKGWFTRSDLMCRFDIKEAAATREIAKYRNIKGSENNLVFNKSLRRYEIKNDTFSPFFKKEITTILSNLKNKNISDIVGFDGFGIDMFPRLSEPKLEIIAPISRAIINKKTIDISYFSVTNGSSKKTIAPHSIFDSGHKLYIRCYCFKYEKFLELALDRIVSFDGVSGDSDSQSQKESDCDWNRFVDLEIEPHPNVEHPETIKYELGFNEQTKVVSVRSALAQYWLQRWSVDCSKTHCLNHKQYHLVLSNRDVLEKVSACIAPGYLLL
ncbi:WYL domain-containing protein [Vibrio cortegadensis]|uniref:WYL domain-containing protein n=1 Tax=Vibrio cortegadensis TaxID=1328770 RepID=A0ABV4MBX2_9VIBR